MRLRVIAGLIASGIIIGAHSPAQAADRFTIDPTHTNVAFLVNHLGYSNMIGRFKEIEGEFTFDEKDIAANKVKVTVKTASIDTNHEARDKHLRSPDFFNTAEFPTMTFVSTKVEKTGERSGKITGDVTLLGVTKSVTFDITFNKMAPHPLPRYNAILTSGFSARGSIKRSDFGMKYGIPGVGDEITLFIEVEGAKAS